MNAGALDRRVTFRRATVVFNDFGEEERTWANLATMWASKEELRDAERVRAAQVGASITTRFCVRNNAITSGITTSDQIRCEGVTYNITGKKEIGRRVGWEFTANAEADL